MSSTPNTDKLEKLVDGWLGNLSQGTNTIKAVQSLLNDDPNKNQYLALMIAREPLLKLRTDKYIELTQAREKCRHPKDKDLTDWDRRVMNDSMVAELQAEYDYLLGLEELVKERINYQWQ